MRKLTFAAQATALAAAIVVGPVFMAPLIGPPSPASNVAPSASRTALDAHPECTTGDGPEGVWPDAALIEQGGIVTKSADVDLALRVAFGEAHRPDLTIVAFCWEK